MITLYGKGKHKGGKLDGREQRKERFGCEPKR